MNTAEMFFNSIKDITLNMHKSKRGTSLRRYVLRPERRADVMKKAIVEAKETSPMPRYRIPSIVIRSTSTRKIESIREATPVGKSIKSQVLNRLDWMNKRTHRSALELIVSEFKISDRRASNIIKAHGKHCR